ncbi:HSF-type DNA-binding-domain-containing protein [Pseudomassariella vexata]|uniref:Transcription factor n=1 Tax=Pseudomassariella vexata TaxID=1141098 RepID=A0A1Y2EAH8_9PEZI|nr:HSF-type DNA-binding-domain-containing protein [Pseudomassariella vexata]ORY68256.1 HSF-type DNA-binding-domain-containing protein [Pseudomassariella vexata]
MPPESDMAVAQGGSNNSSDFVRKLYKMLEDPAYSEVVRWGNEGDSFVVLENEKFTKTILPKHFKHSNFASFVRQLNKYDFHKVRQNEENGQSPYGHGAWEFKHPEFRADAKNSLDNIRRKAPAPRKAQAPEENYGSNTQVQAMSESLAATQQQVQALQDSYFEMAHANKVFVDEILHLQKLVKSQTQVHEQLLTYLNKVETDRRHGRSSSNHSNHSTPAAYGTGNLMSDGTEEPSVELRRVRELLNSIQGEHIPEKDLRQMSIQFQQIGASPESAGSSSMMGPPNSASINNQFIHDPMNDMRHMVYPVGQTIGIDPFAAEHLGNIPYNRPLSQNAIGPVNDSAGPTMPSVSPPVGGTQGGSPWGLKKPRILLVEDDKTCSRIGSKFLAQYDCGVEVARDGLEAVNKVNTNPNWFDLIFMDIVMPQLDGVSATAMILDAQPRIPIIAMTSNINQQDLEMYFHWGMRDVLAKPFTKDGMIKKLQKHLPGFLRNPPADAVAETMYQNGAPPGQPPTPGPYVNPGPMSLPIPAASTGVAKFDTTPVQSPATSTSWHSPGQIPQQSPNLAHDQAYLNAGSGQVMSLTPGGTQRPFPGSMMPAMGGPPGSRMAESVSASEGPPEKRQRFTYAQ